MDLLPQPDFQKLTQSLGNAVEQISLIPNIPTVSDGQTIAAQLQQIARTLAQHGEQLTTVLTTVATIQTELTTLRDGLTTVQDGLTTVQDGLTTVRDDIASIKIGLDASETNAVARLYNSTVTTIETSLLPIHDRRDRPVDGFPENGRVLARLTNDQLSALLQAYNQSTDGTLTLKRKRFRRFIGVMVEI